MSPFDPFAAEHEFEGGVVGDGVADGKRKAVVRISDRGVEARTESDEHVLIPWGKVRLDMGGADGTVVFCHHRRKSTSIYSSDADFLRAIEGAGGNEVVDQIARMAGEKVSSRTKHLAGCTVFLALSFALIVLTPRACRSTLDGVVDAIPYSVDESIGEAVVDSMDAGGSELDDDAVNAAMQAIFDRLEPHSALTDAEFQFRVIENEMVNAFALPGGFITIYTGLIEQADSIDMVAGVLAHEMAHVTERHGLRRIAHSLGTIAGLRLILGDTQGLLSVATELFTLASVNDYSQDQEASADREGTRMLIASGLDPQGLIEFFDKMKELAPEVPRSLEWMSTHPQFDDRVSLVREVIAENGELPARQPIDVDWDAVRARIKR